MIHIAKTKKEYIEGLKDPSKNIMYFPNANNMTMKGMKTPIKYYGITNGMITDEGYAKPGQKFNVNGVSTLEVRMPIKSKAQASSPLFNINGKLVGLDSPEYKEYLKKQTGISRGDAGVLTTPQQQNKGLVERVLDNANNYLSNIIDKDQTSQQQNNSTPGVEDMRLPFSTFKPTGPLKPNELTFLPRMLEKNKSFNYIERGPSLQNSPFSLQSSIKNSEQYSDLNERANIAPLNEGASSSIYQGQSSVVPESRLKKNDYSMKLFPGIYSGILDKSKKLFPGIYSAMNPKITSTNKPSELLSEMAPELMYAINKVDSKDSWFMPGFEDLIDDNNKSNTSTSTVVQGGKPNTSTTTTTPGLIKPPVSNVTTTTTGKPEDKKPEDKKAAETKPETKPDETKTTTSATSNASGITTSSTFPRFNFDVTSGLNSPSGKTLRYTDGKWYMTPGGTQYRTVPVTSSTTEGKPEETKTTESKSNVTTTEKKEESPKKPSSAREEKLKKIYDNLDRNYNQYTNKLSMDRSDRAIDRYYNLMDKAEMAKEIGNDRRAGRLTRRAERVSARIPGLITKEEANERIRDARNEVRTARINSRSSQEANRREELAKRLEQRAGMLPRIINRRSDFNISNVDAEQGRRREVDRNAYNRMQEDLDQAIERAKYTNETKDYGTKNRQKYRTNRNEEQESDLTNRTIQRELNKQRNISSRYNTSDNQRESKPVTQEEMMDKYESAYRRRKGQLSTQADNPFFSEGRNASIFDEPYQKHEIKFPDYSKADYRTMINKAPNVQGIPYSGQTYFGGTDPSFSLNYNSTETKDANTTDKKTDTKTDVTDKSNPYFLTKGEATQLAGSMLPGFYNLAQSMRKPHKFKEFQNPYDFQYLSNLASNRMPYDDSKIIAQQNRIMRSAQEQAPNFQTAQAYQTAGMDSLNRQLKDYQMKNYMINQQYAQDYNRAAQDVYGKREAIKADTYGKDRATQAALNQLQHKAVTQLGIGINDLGKLFVNRENQNVDWSMLSEIYSQYGLAPLQAVAEGRASGSQIIRFKNNPQAMQQYLDQVEKQKTANATTGTTTNNQDATTTTTGTTTNTNTTTSPTYRPMGGALGQPNNPTGGALRQTKKEGGKVFNINAINNINKYR